MSEAKLIKVFYNVKGMSMEFKAEFHVPKIADREKILFQLKKIQPKWDILRIE